MFISPMLLQKKEEPFNDDNYIAELKLDGIRLIYSNVNGVKLYTRHNNDVTERFPELHALNIPQGTILDGELIVTDEEGKPDFEAVMSRFMSSKSKYTVNYCVFDVLYHEGKDITKLPLLKRKEILDKVVEENSVITKVRTIAGNNAEALFGLCVEQGLEGIVLKRADSKYEANKRSWSWQKVINYSEETVFITGYRKKEFGWLIGKEDESGEIRPVGTIEFGTSSDERKAFYNVVQSIKITENKDYVLIEPDRIQCNVKFRNWTKAGMMRIPVFQKFVV